MALSAVLVLAGLAADGRKGDFSVELAVPRVFRTLANTSASPLAIA
jgi:hypothetical protein